MNARAAAAGLHASIEDETRGRARRRRAHPSKATLTWIAAAATWLAPALEAHAAEVKFSEAQNAITIEGSIEPGDEYKFAALVDRRPHEVIIRSDGGAQQPALVIAREVHARGMTVIVDGYCASACAQIIFAAGAERRIRPNSFVAFHGGNVPVLHAVRDALQQATEQTQDGVTDSDPRRGALQQALLKSQRDVAVVDGLQTSFETEMKLDPGVSEFYKRLTAPRHIKVDIQVGKDLEVHYQVRGGPAECDWWIPDREGLARLGLDLRNAYDVPPIGLLATATRSPATRIYVGPPVALDDPSFATLCNSEPASAPGSN